MEYQKKEIRIFQNGRTVNDQFYIDGIIMFRRQNGMWERL